MLFFGPITTIFKQIFFCLHIVRKTTFENIKMPHRKYFKTHKIEGEKKATRAIFGATGAIGATGAHRSSGGWLRWIWLWCSDTGSNYYFTFSLSCPTLVQIRRKKTPQKKISSCSIRTSLGKNPVPPCLPWIGCTHPRYMGLQKVVGLSADAEVGHPSAGFQRFLQWRPVLHPCPI